MRCTRCGWTPAGDGLTVRQAGLLLQDHRDRGCGAILIGETYRSCGPGPVRLRVVLEVRYQAGRPVRVRVARPDGTGRRWMNARELHQSATTGAGAPRRTGYVRLP